MGGRDPTNLERWRHPVAFTGNCSANKPRAAAANIEPQTLSPTLFAALTLRVFVPSRAQTEPEKNVRNDKLVLACVKYIFPFLPLFSVETVLWS